MSDDSDDISGYNYFSDSGANPIDIRKLQIRIDEAYRKWNRHQDRSDTESSLRDQFAVQALQILIARKDRLWSSDIDSMPREAYRWADSMLEARKHKDREQETTPRRDHPA